MGGATYGQCGTTGRVCALFPQLVNRRCHTTGATTVRPREVEESCWKALCYYYAYLVRVRGWWVHLRCLFSSKTRLGDCLTTIYLPCHAFFLLRWLRLSNSPVSKESSDQDVRVDCLAVYMAVSSLRGANLQCILENLFQYPKSSCFRPRLRKRPVHSVTRLLFPSQSSPPESNYSKLNRHTRVFSHPLVIQCTYVSISFWFFLVPRTAHTMQ